MYLGYGNIVDKVNFFYFIIVLSFDFYIYDMLVLKRDISDKFVLINLI